MKSSSQNYHLYEITVTNLIYILHLAVSLSLRWISSKVFVFSFPIILEVSFLQHLILQVRHLQNKPVYINRI